MKFRNNLGYKAYRMENIVNSNNLQKRKIIYKCSYCETVYENADICPGCNASTADALVVSDNLDAVLEKDIANERTELIDKGTYSTYTVITILHLLSCGAFVGFLVSPLMLLVHLVYHLVKRKKPHPLVIFDGVFCLLMTILIVCVVLDIL